MFEMLYAELNANIGQPNKYSKPIIRWLERMAEEFKFA